MATLASQEPRFAHWRQEQPAAALAHIPGETGWPVIGNTLRQLADPIGFNNRMRARYGDVYRNRSFGLDVVALCGAEANELVLFDRQHIFSSEQGWGPLLDQLFPRGLMLMDFEHHRLDRKALSGAFKPAPMRHYADALNRGIAAHVAQWRGRRMQFYPAVKAMTLDLAAESFLGVPLGPEADRINRAFIDAVQASVAVVRRPLPFTAMGRGVAGRRTLAEWFAVETLKRRGDDGGQDMFSQFARATREDGALLPVDDVVDHMIFLMMAAHDTITSSASSLVWLLATHPEWQERLRAEVLAVTGGAGRPLAYDDLARLEMCDMAFREALRLVPPVPSTPRRALAEFSFGGYRVPAGTQVTVSAAMVHAMPELWPEPARFDPLRFRPEDVARRHKYAWVPFGGGAHMCLGLHFATMQVKILLAHLLANVRVTAQTGYAPRWQAWPIPKPRDGLWLTFEPV